METAIGNDATSTAQEDDVNLIQGASAALAASFK